MTDKWIAHLRGSLHHHCRTLDKVAELIHELSSGAYNEAVHSGCKGTSYGKTPGDPLSVASVRGHHRTIHAALEQAVRWGLVARNVADSVEPPKIEKKREMRALSAEGVQKLLDVA